MRMRQFPKQFRKDFSLFSQLNTPQKIQGFLDTLPFNFEESEATCHSPFFTLEQKKAHCVEGAVLAAAALWYHGIPPLLLDLRATKNDDDHVVALFRDGKHWGAISKTNHGVLRFRDALYRDPKELTMSYFHEYFLKDGEKTLRAFSKPFSLLHYDDDWLTTPDHLWQLCIDLDDSPHSNILGKNGARKLRNASTIEIQLGEIVEWKRH